MSDVNFNLDSELLDVLLDTVKQEDKLPDGTIKRYSHSNYVGKELNDGSYDHSKYFAPALCYVKVSELHDHGVFSATSFKPGDVIEESKVILLNTTESNLTDWVIATYGMKWDCDCDICKANGKTYYIATGNIMMYNHSDTPNVYFSVDKDTKKISVIALRTIQKNEELLRHYGMDYNDTIKKIISMHPRIDLPENKPGYIKSTNCVSCQSDNTPMFRSMIVPERVIE